VNAHGVAIRVAVLNSLEGLQVNHHPEPLPEGIDIVKCRSAAIIACGPAERAG
jgi:hypothetical protein